MEWVEVRGLAAAPPPASVHSSPDGDIDGQRSGNDAGSEDLAVPTSAPLPSHSPLVRDPLPGTRTGALPSLLPTRNPGPVSWCPGADPTDWE